MEDFFEVIVGIIKWIFKIILYISYFFIDNTFFDIGYYSLKIITVASFPKNKKEAKKYFIEITLFGIVVTVLMVLIYYNYFYCKVAV